MLAAVLAFVGVAGFFGLRFLSEKNREQTLKHIDISFDKVDLSQANRTIQLALHGDSLEVLASAIMRALVFTRATTSRGRSLQKSI